MVVIIYVQKVEPKVSGPHYILVDDDGFVTPVNKYLLYIYTISKSKSTQKVYCYSLKHYFCFLKEMQKSYDSIKLEDLFEFVGWLSSPVMKEGVNNNGTGSNLSEKTINLTISVVFYFYDFCYRSGDIDSKNIEKLLDQVYIGKKKSYKSSSHPIYKRKCLRRKRLKVREPRRKVDTLSIKQVRKIISVTTNQRDAFLIRLLYETGMRIGEVLSLINEDFIINDEIGHRIRVVDRDGRGSAAKLITAERELFISQSLINHYNHYLETFRIDSSFVFVKIRGINKGKPLNYSDVAALFRCLRNKSGIDVSPRLFRHTHAAMFLNETGSVMLLQERLGHQHIQSTNELYNHPLQDRVRKVWEKAQPAFNRF